MDKSRNSSHVQTEVELASALQNVQEQEKELEQEKGENRRLQDLCDELMHTLEAHLDDPLTRQPRQQNRGNRGIGKGAADGEKGDQDSIISGSRVNRIHRARPTFGIPEKSALDGEEEREGGEGEYAAAMDSHVQKLDSMLGRGPEADTDTDIDIDVDIETGTEIDTNIKINVNVNTDGPGPPTGPITGPASKLKSAVSPQQLDILRHRHKQGHGHGQSGLYSPNNPASINNTAVGVSALASADWDSSLDRDRSQDLFEQLMLEGEGEGEDGGKSTTHIQIHIYRYILTDTYRILMHTSTQPNIEYLISKLNSLNE